MTTRGKHIWRRAVCCNCGLIVSRLMVCCRLTAQHVSAGQATNRVRLDSAALAAAYRPACGVPSRDVAPHLQNSSEDLALLVAGAWPGSRRETGDIQLAAAVTGHLVDEPAAGPQAARQGRLQKLPRVASRCRYKR